MINRKKVAVKRTRYITDQFLVQIYTIYIYWTRKIHIIAIYNVINTELVVRTQVFQIC